MEQFLSTPSARRATRYWQTSASKQFYFYPRPPRGGRPLGIGTISPIELISIHALREEGDDVLCQSTANIQTIELISIHALREEGD